MLWDGDLTLRTWGGGACGCGGTGAGGAGADF